jgi:hypothetical protein
MNKLWIFFVVLCIAGCSNKAVYDNMRVHQRNECLRQQPVDYAECIERTSKTYEEYARERKEALERKP